MPNNHAKHIAVVLRRDSTKKPGGDVDLLKHWSTLHFGHDNVILTNIDNLSSHLSKCKLVVSANIDRPAEAYYALLQAQRHRIPFWLHTLHHPYNGISAYLRHGLHDSRWLAAAITNFSARGYEQVAFTLETAKRWVCLKPQPYRLISHFQKHLLKNSNRLIVVNNKERKQIELDFNMLLTSEKLLHEEHPVKLYETTNNSEPVLSFTKQHQYTLIAGRIEERKNQLNLLKWIENRNLHLNNTFLLVGGPGTNARYVKNVLSTASRLGVQHMPHVSYDDLLHLIRSSSNVINPSWFEVMSLIDKIALHCNKDVYSTPYSYLTAHKHFKIDPSKNFTGLENAFE